MPMPFMPPWASRPLESQGYRMALMLCPPLFRREHGDEMSRDFDELRGEAAACGSGALWRLRLVMAIDLLRTFGVQWLRTGFPVIALVAASVQFIIALGLAAFAKLAVIPPPRRGDAAHPDAEAIGVLLLGVVAIVVIVMTISINLWVTRLNRRRRFRLR